MGKQVKRMDYLDLLRVLALGSVILFHYFFNGISKGHVTSVSLTPFASIAKYGYLGVELFFLISGFVIIYSTQNRSVWQFIKRRFLRLYPMYWLALLTIFAIARLPIWDKKGPSIRKLILNFTMIPTAFGGRWVDEAHWFLLRELQFYLVIIFVMAVGLGKRIPQIFPWWAIIICIWNLLNLPRFEVWYFSGYFALMAGGAIIFSIREWGITKIRVIGLLAAYICSMDTRMSKAAWLGEHRSSSYNKYVIGVIVTVAFLLILATLSSKISEINFKWAGVAGAVTYPLFLIHGRLGLLAIQDLANNSNKFFVYPMVIIVLIGIAYGLLKLEKKLTSARF